MLPNWLYGKSKSKLADILGGGGGTPSDYNKVKAQVTQNTEDIASLDDTLDTKAALTQITNPNLFDNPWFTVNQRAVTSVTQNTDYIADRWMVYFGENNATITRNNDGNIVMDNSLGTTNITIYQKITQTYLKSLVGQKLTASMMLSDGTIYSGTITYTGTGNPVYFENDYVKAHAPVLTASQIITFSVKPGASVTIKALKLELGSVSTLAMDTAPNYATELLKCRRYFQRINVNFAVIQGILADTTNARFPIKLEPEMREVPSLTISNIANFVATRGYYADASTLSSLDLLSGANSKQFVVLNAVLTTAKDALSPIFLGKTSDTPGGYIDLSAEL